MLGSRESDKYPSCPICGLLLQHLSSPQPGYRRIPLLTGPRSTYPVGIGSSAIRPSIAPNRRRVRCPSASSSQYRRGEDFPLLSFVLTAQTQHAATASSRTLTKANP